MKQRWNIIDFLLGVVLFVFIPMMDVKAQDAMELQVTYQEPVACGEEITFCLDAIHVQPEDDLVYHVDTIYIWGENGIRELLVDPSRLPAYNTSKIRSFTFYTSGTYTAVFAVMNRSTSPVTIARKQVTIEIEDASHPSVEQLVKRIAEECETKCETNYEKALYLHDYLIAQSSYDNSLLYCNEEGVLARGKGTCESYHRAYCKLLEAVGIPTGRMVGNGHVWTAVQLEGKWYQVDVTWDDPTYDDDKIDLQHLYFGLNDTVTMLVHSDHVVEAGYESNDFEYNYFIQSQKIKTISDPIKEEIEERVKQGETRIVVDCSKESMLECYKDILYPIVAYQLSEKETYFDYEVRATYQRQTQEFVCQVEEKTSEEVSEEPTEEGTTTTEKVTEKPTEEHPTVTEKPTGESTGEPLTVTEKPTEEEISASEKPTEQPHVVTEKPTKGNANITEKATEQPSTSTEAAKKETVTTTQKKTEIEKEDEKTSEAGSKTEALYEGKKVLDDSKKGYYKIKSRTKKTVTFISPKNRRGTSFSVPASVKIDGITFQVAAIGDYAFRNNRQLKKVVLSVKLDTMGKKLFTGCKRLKKITIKSTRLTSKKMASKTFGGVSKKIVIEVPKQKKKVYEKLFRKKGLGKKGTIK